MRKKEPLLSSCRLVHHSDRGTQYFSMRYTNRLSDARIACIAPSVGSRGDSYHNALGESVLGLFKTEVIRGRDRGDMSAVEFVTLERLLGPIGYFPPAEYDARYNEQPAVA